MTSPVDIPGSPLRGSHEDDAGLHARHSPTLSRPVDPNDPSHRERQRTMDVDMALHLSRARRETVSAGVASSPPSASPQAVRTMVPDHGLVGLSSSEQYDLDLAKGADEEALDISESPVEEDLEDRGDSQLPSTPGVPDLLNMEIQGGQDPSLLVTSTPPLHLSSSPVDDSQVALQNLGGLPTYQDTHATTSHYQFDFNPMEAYASEEKKTLGLSSPPTNARFSLSQLRSPRKLKAPAPSGSDDGRPPSPSAPGASGEGSTPRVRQRKLSQSNAPRHRKGIGGKLALFEAGNNLDLRLGPAHANGPTDDSGVFAPGPSSSGGILNTGHDRPYRFSLYSNALGATIHARSLSELPAEGQTFHDLFHGILPPGKAGTKSRPHSTYRSPGGGGGAASTATTTPGYFSQPKIPSSAAQGGPMGLGGPVDDEASTWWLDITSPTDEEMKMLSKVFGIHPLTTEDILMEEAREKIELFRNYYLVCFRSFDQDPYSPTHLEPLNMYIIVFREGTLSFHFRQTPHPQSVRRRIKQLKDYISVTSDWISYALIDDITDAFGPLIQSIEYEVDSIDELVLILKEAEQTDMLRRIGTCRKKVMGLLRLMGNKADVVKGLAKRCNENWRVAPTSDIGLYLSDIQDHLITMTQNLNHYEKILSRSHSNYLAQISIEMTDANNQINDVLSKLTALGTVLIPMNLVTGLWGMNVHVPGQDVDGFKWFGGIIACLIAFAAAGGFVTYRFMVKQ